MRGKVLYVGLGPIYLLKLKNNDFTIHEKWNHGFK